MKPPSYHEVRVIQLKKEVKNVKEVNMKSHEEEFAKNGCSIMCDGWTNKCGRTLINFLVNNAKGTMSVESVDVLSYAKDGKMMNDLLENCGKSWKRKCGASYH